MKDANWLERRVKLKQKADDELEQHRREAAAKLGIGYGNGKQFLYRLNHYGITRDAFEEAVNS